MLIGERAGIRHGSWRDVVTAVCAIGVLLTASSAWAQGFTDDPLVPGVTVIKAVHLLELRARIDAQRERGGLGSYGWSEDLIPGVTTIKALQFLELRTALDAAYVAFERTVPTYTDGLVVGAIVRAVYVSELRTSVQTLEAIACAPQVSQTQVWVGAAATSTSTTVTTWGGCTWGSTSQATWLTIATGATGAGNGTVDVVVAANDTGAPRTGSVTIADRTLTVRQAADAAPTPTVSFDGVSSSAAATGASSIVYYHTDAIGSVRLVTGDGGRVVARYDYLPFGVELNAPVFENTRMFTGQERDKQTSLDYFGARYYQSQTGRFTSPDLPGIDQNPFDSQSWNLYSYVRNNPLRYVDPTGQKCENGYNAETGSFCTETTGEDLSRRAQEAWRDSQRFFLDSLFNHLLTPQVANFSAGLGDALLLGSGPYFRRQLDINVVDQCSTAYGAGGWSSFAFGAARVGYAGLAKGASVLASSGAQASAFRQGLKTAARLGMASGWRQPNLAKYGTDEALRAAAGRTNPFVNAWGAGTAAAGAAGALGCGR